MGIFNQFKDKIIKRPTDGVENVEDSREVDNLIALGVLLWVVAEADDKFLPEESEHIKKILKTYGEITNEDMPIVLRAIKEAAIDRIDIHKFTHEVKSNLTYENKVVIVENLFRVACSDGELADEEHEAIRQMSGLLGLEHREFIESKIKVKKEFGLNTT